MRTSASATLDGEWAVPLYVCQEVSEWSRTQALCTAAISLGGWCVREYVARVGGCCAVVRLANERHHVVCAVCITCDLKVNPSLCIGSQSFVALLRLLLRNDYS